MTRKTEIPSGTFKDRFGEAGPSRLPLLAFLLALAVAMGGCQMAIRDSRGPSAPMPDEESFAEFMDVPFPAVMTLERDDTYTYTRKEVKAGVVTVLGRMTVEELGAFYDNHLPNHGWRPVAEAQSVKLVSSWFKEGRVLTIIATPVVMAIGGNLRVELWVAPPRSASDLGHRTIYRSTGDSEPLLKTKPIRWGKDEIDEEDI
jgi:hypothetical protein